MRNSIFSAVIFILLINLSCLAQPAEFFLIEENIKEPDKLISSEFSKDIDGDVVFSVEMSSNKSYQELESVFKENTGLSVIAMSYSQNNSVWKFRMKKVSESFLKISEFESLLNADWQSMENHISYSIDSLSISLKIRFDKPEQLQHNLQLVEKFGLKFSGTEPHPNSSVAIFTKNFNEKIDKEPVAVEPDIFKDFTAELTESGNIIENNSSSGALSIRLQVNANKFSDFFKTLEKNSSLLSSLSLDSELDSISTFSIKGRTSNNTASEDKIANLHSLFQLKSLQWIFNASDYSSGIVLSGFNTDFQRKIQLIGYTPNSSDIFTKVFPVLKNCGFIGNPFFSRGTYLQKRKTRIMKFTIDLDWIE